MQRIIRNVLAILLLLTAPAYAGGAMGLMVAAGSSAAPPSCTRGITLISETFEAYANGAEWSTANWAETHASTDFYTADNTVYYAGSLSGKAVRSGGAGNWVINRSFTQQTSGKVSVEFWYRISATDQPGAAIYIGNATDLIACNCEYDSGSGYLRTYNGSSWNNLAALSANTWYKVEMIFDIDNYSGSSACTYYIGGGSAIGPYATYNSGANAPDILALDQYNVSTGTTRLDNITVYDGDRCNP
jgi:hypothetical protein